MATSFFTEEQLQQLDQNSVGDSRYLKLNKLTSGKEYRYRFVGQGITGWEGWVENDKGESTPIRYDMKPSELPENLKPDMNGKKDLKFFMAGLVWDYQEETFKIFSIVQKTLMDKIKKYAMDPDYGDPNGYDIKITRNEKEGRVSYDLIAAPPKPLAKTIQIEYDNTRCDLTRLYDGEDPFADPSA